MIVGVVTRDNDEVKEKEVTKTSVCAKMWAVVNERIPKRASGESYDTSQTVI